MAHSKEEKIAQLKFMFIYGLFQILGFSVLLFTSIWLVKYLDGFEWNGTLKQLNVHVLCMVIGMVFLVGNAIVLYHIYANPLYEEKLRFRMAPSTLHILAIAAIVVGLVATCEYHRAQKIPNMYSIHSWFGVITIVLYMLMFFSILRSYHSSKAHDKHSVVDSHRTCAKTVFILVAITAVSGLFDRLALEYPPSVYESLPSGAGFGNAIGLIIVAFIVTGIVLISLPILLPHKKKCDEEELK